jgi:predicted ATPase
VPAVGQAIGYAFSGPTEPRQQLLNHLRRKQMLLLLDDFEHLLEGAGWVTEVLRAVPEVKVLVTSRAALNLPGEHRLPIEGMGFPRQPMGEDAAEPDRPTLPLPPAAEEPGIASADWPNAAQYSAVQLFLSSARRVAPDLKLSSNDLRHVARICHLVEGMPLAILLAAAWTPLLHPAEIADEISRNLAFLESSAPGAPERQRSMRAAFDHSWRLLSEREQAVFRGLSVFRGGFTREAAGHVTGATLHELMALAILRRYRAGRELALCLLVAASQHVPQKQSDRRQRFEEALAISREMGFPLGAGWALLGLGRSEESLRISRSAGDRRGMAVALIDEGRRAYTDQEYARAQRLYQESRALAQEIHLQWAIEWNASNLGDVSLALCEHEEAKMLYLQALARSREIGHQPGILHALRGLGHVATAVGDDAAAWTYYRQALRLAVEMPPTKSTAHALDTIAGMATLLARDRRAAGAMGKELGPQGNATPAAQQAVELAILALQHPSSQRKTQDTAQALLERLQATVPPTMFAAAAERGGARELWTTVEALLGELGG